MTTPRPPVPPVPPGSKTGACAVGLATAVVFSLLQELLLLQPRLVELDPEELYNAAHGEFVHELGLRALLPLQYRPFCGGCTLDAGIDAALLAALPPSLHTWKLVPILLGALALGSLAASMWRRAGPAAGLSIALVAVATPPSWARLGLVGWGNHYEASCFVLLALAAATWAEHRPPRALLVGVVAGAGCWVGLSAAFAVPTIVLLLTLRRRWASAAWLLPGLAIGGAPALLRWSITGESPLSTIYEAGEALPALSRIPAKAWTLLPPRQLAGLLGVRHPMLGPIAAIAAVATIAVAASGGLRRAGLQRLPALLVGGWLAIYLVVRFQVSVAPVGVIPTPGDVRYAAPVVILAAVLVSLGAAECWTRGRRVLAAGLWLPWLVAGVGGRLAALAPPFPATDAQRMRAADFEFFREQASWAMSDDLRQAAAASANPRVAAVAAYARGRRDLLAAWPRPEEAREVGPLPPPADGSPAWAEGVAGALTDRLDPDADGDRASLRRAERLLSSLAAAWPDEWETAGRRAICWRRADGGADDAVLARALDTADLQALLARPATAADAPWRRAVAWCAGRRWGRDRAERWQPRVLAIPTAALSAGDVEAAFAAGLGRALGEAWGPPATEVTPTWTHPESRISYASGVSAGSRLRWLSSAAPGPALAPPAASTR